MIERMKEPGSPVAKEQAREHALVAMRSNWAAGVYGFEGWKGYTLEDEPLVIYDLNGQILFYEYEVRDGGKLSGSLKASASKAIGSAVPQIQLTPRNWDPEYALNKAEEEVKKRYPRSKIAETELVCYSYPKIGVRVYTEDGGSLIFDVASLKLIDQFGADEPEGLTSWSFYNEVALPDAERKEKLWEIENKELRSLKSGVPGLFEGKFGAEEQREIQKFYAPELVTPMAAPRIIPAVTQKVIQFCPHCTTHDCHALHAQETDYYCAVATGQMILDFYRYYYSQDEIAKAMGTGSSYGTTNTGQVAGYEKLSNYCLDALYDMTANWGEAKAEIDANRPLKSGIPGHARACFGWKRENITIIGTKPKRWLYILDPWPWNSDSCKGGAIYWEDWDAVTHSNFIYVRHRSTPCK